MTMIDTTTTSGASTTNATVATMAMIGTRIVAMTSTPTPSARGRVRSCASSIVLPFQSAQGVADMAQRTRWARSPR